MKYSIGIIGQQFLLSLGVRFNDKNFDPGAILKGLSPKEEESFKYSIYNSNFYSRAAGEIMKEIFTPDENEKLKKLIEEFENQESSLISKASSKVDKIMNEHKNDSVPLRAWETLTSEDEAERMLKGIVIGVFEQIPPYALNLLGLIEVEPAHFSQSYNLFKQMLKTLNENTTFYEKKKIKEHFSQALKELENLVESVKKKNKADETKKEETVNLGKENAKNETSSEQIPPNQNNSEGDKHNPTDSNEKSETQNNSENNEGVNEPNNDTSPDLTNLQDLKIQAIFDITAALNEIPPLTSSDLSSKYQDWKNEINNLSDEKDINFLKVSMLSHVEVRRKKKIKRQTTSEVSEIINSNLQKAQNPNATIQDKKKVLAENEQYEGQTTYEDVKVKEQVKNLKKEVARDNLAEYRDKVISDLATKLNINRLKESELDPETRSEIERLKKETDPDKLVEKEVKIIQKISQQGATKKITRFEKEAEAALESNDKTKIDELKKQIIEFMKSSNVYYQAKKREAQELLKQLESDLTINNSDFSETLPFSAQMGIGMGVVLVVLFFTLLVYRKKQMDFFSST